MSNDNSDEDDLLMRHAAAIAARDDRIARALAYAVYYGHIGGAHHKMWVIDQMVRALTGCPMEPVAAVDARGLSYEYKRQGESDEYRAFVGDAYKWDGWGEGIAP